MRAIFGNLPKFCIGAFFGLIWLTEICSLVNCSNINIACGHQIDLPLVTYSFLLQKDYFSLIRKVYLTG